MKLVFSSSAMATCTRFISSMMLLPKIRLSIVDVIDGSFNRLTTFISPRPPPLLTSSRSYGSSITFEVSISKSPIGMTTYGLPYSLATCTLVVVNTLLDRHEECPPKTDRSRLYNSCIYAFESFGSRSVRVIIFRLARLPTNPRYNLSFEALNNLRAIAQSLGSTSINSVTLSSVCWVSSSRKLESCMIYRSAAFRWCHGTTYFSFIIAIWCTIIAISRASTWRFRCSEHGRFTVFIIHHL